MKKILFLTFSLIILIFSWVFSASANSIPVENIFSDIDTSYEYYDELQTFYDRGMIFPNSDGRFNPYSPLTRDEFVGISMEVACERCIQPHTEYKFIEKYWQKDIYFDVQPENRYFYCIADADDRNFVKWYDAWFTCENGKSRSGERPFCPQNTITLEESIAVLLRNSGVFTIEDNQRVMQDILAWKITENLSDDVSPTNSDGSPYTFYGYLQKALEFELSEFDTDGNKKTYKMLEIKDWKIRPKEGITRERFLLLAYIAFKSNSCSDITTGNIALDIEILPASCSEGDANCSSSDTTWWDDEYDFDSEVRWYCEEGINDPDGYIWRFHNRDTNTRLFRYGQYIDDLQFSPAWNWDVYFRVIDNCGNTWEIRSTFISADDEETDLSIWIDSDVDDDTGDFTWVVTWWVWPYTYDWDFWDGTTGSWKDVTHTYEPWVYEVVLTVTDADGNTSETTTTITIWEDRNNIIADIEVDTLIWFEDLLVWIEWVATGWVWPYTYDWDFWDGDSDVWANLDHIYDNPGTYEITLIVTDSEGNTWEATVLIQVLEWDSCDKDSDGDGVVDCDDKCPSVWWVDENLWCPILDDSDEPTVDLGNGLEWTCIYQKNTAKIFWNAVCNSCPCSNGLDFLADIRKCDIIFPAITSPDARTIYSKWRSVQVR